MEEEEAALRKQLEDTEDFDERREIRQKLRELRKKRLAALETDSPTTTDRDKRREERRRQRERENEENKSSAEIKSQGTTIDIVSNEGTEKDTVIKSFQLSVNTTQTTVVENGTVNGSAKEEESKEVEDLEASEENGMLEEEPGEVEAEQPAEVTTEEQAGDGSGDDKEKDNDTDANKDKMTLESSLLMIEEIEDLDNLERLLKDIPLTEFEVRKKIRGQIRMLRVKQAHAKTTLSPSELKPSTHQPKAELARNETADSKTTKPEKNQEKDKVDGKKEPRKTAGPSDKGTSKVVDTKTVEKKGGAGATFEIKGKMSVEVSVKDGNKKEVTKVEEKTEVHKTDGTTVTLTKTTKTTEVQKKAAPARGGANSIEARLAQMKKDRVMAKKQAAASTKNKRDAFKQQLESQSSSKTPVKRSFSAKSNVTLLMEWCRRRTAYYEGVDITNFTTSWANGLAFCALLHYFVPDKIPYDSLSPSDKKGNWSLGFQVAGQEGIEPLLELEDVMCVDVPEPKSLITYIHFVYTHFMEKQQKEKAAAGK